MTDELKTITLSALDLAALLCSRVCHDAVGPVGAIVNGLELLDEDDSAETQALSLDLIRKSSRQASASSPPTLMTSPKLRSGDW